MAKNTIDGNVSAYADGADIEVTDIVDRPPAGDPPVTPPHAATPGTIKISATLDNTIDATTAAAAVAISGGAVGVSVAGGGAVALNTILGSAKAYAEDSVARCGRQHPADRRQYLRHRGRDRRSGGLGSVWRRGRCGLDRHRHRP